MLDDQTNKLQKLNARLHSILGSSTSITKPNEKEIIDQFNQFHEYYNSRYHELKEFTDKLSKQNWEYSNKILRYQQKFNQFQSALAESNNRIQQLTRQVKAFQTQKDKLDMYQETVKAKDLVIEKLNKKISELTQQQRVNRKTLIRPKDAKISNRLVEQTLTLQIQWSKQQNQRLQNELSTLKLQNGSLKKRIKQLEVEKTFQQERIKNAVLSVELDLKMKDNQIERLKQQISIYEQKFKHILKQVPITSQTQMLGISKENRSIKDLKDKYLQPKTKKELLLLIDEESQLFQDIVLKSCRNKGQKQFNMLYSPSQSLRRKICQSKSSQKIGKDKNQQLFFQSQISKVQIDDQKTCVKEIFLNKKSIAQPQIKQNENLQLQTERTEKRGGQNAKKKCHKRTCSSNLENKQNRQSGKPFDMKVKIYRCDKSARRSNH